MTNSSPPNPPDSSDVRSRSKNIKKNILDEWIAVLVAFGVIGTVLFASFGTKSLDWKNLFETRERRLFALTDNGENTDDTRLNVEQDSERAEQKSAISSSLKAPQATGSEALENVPSRDFAVLRASERDRSRESSTNLLPIAVPSTILPGIIIPETEPETPETPVVTETEPETPETPVVTETEPETPVVTETEPETPVVTETQPETPVVTETEPETPVIAETQPETPNSKLAFQDVPQEHWAYPFIQPLGKKNFIMSASGNNFAPDQPITRAGMADLVSHAFKDNPENLPTKNFKDVAASNPKFSDINKAVKMGFMKGYSDQKFHPELQIPRYQVLVTLATGLGLTPQGNPNNILKKFGDRDQIPDWAKAQVAAAIQSALVVNRPGFDFSSLEPTQPATRAEVAAMIYQTLVKYDKVDLIESTYIVPYP